MGPQSGLGDFLIKDDTSERLVNLKGTHRYSNVLLNRQAEPDGTELERWKFRLERWTLEGLAYYEAELYGNEQAPNKRFAAAPGDVPMPTGSMPENVAYIWPDKAEVYCGSKPLPPSNDSNVKMAHRDLVSLHNAGHALKDIVATVPQPPPKSQNKNKNGPDDDRPPPDRLGGRLSQREQVYRDHLGVFSPVVRNQESAKSANVYEVLQYTSIGNLFHAVLGSIDPFRFKWSPPHDPVHIDPASNVPANYDLPPPHDILEYDRERINKLRGDRNLQPLPSFAKFLSDCSQTLIRYFPTTYSKLYSPRGIPFFNCELDVMKSIEKERMKRWGEIKGWSEGEVAAAKVKLDGIASKQDRRRKRRNSSMSTIQLDAASPSRKVRGSRGSHQASDAPGFNVDSAPRTPSQKQRRRSDGGAMQAPDMVYSPSLSYPRQDHSSPLGHAWSPPLANIHEQETASLSNNGHYAANVNDHNNWHIAPDHSNNGAGYFDPSSRIASQTSDRYPMAVGDPGRLAGPGNSSSAIQDSSSRMTGRSEYHSANSHASRDDHPGLYPTRAAGDLFVAPSNSMPSSFNQQQTSSQMPPPHGMSSHNGYTSTDFRIPPGSNLANLRTPPLTQAGLPFGLGYNQPRFLNQSQASNDYDSHRQYADAPGYGGQFAQQGVRQPEFGNSFAQQGGFVTQSGYAPNHGNTQESTLAHQAGGSHNAMVQNQDNSVAQSPMVGNAPAPFPQEGAYFDSEQRLAVEERINKWLHDGEE